VRLSRGIVAAVIAVSLAGVLQPAPVTAWTAI
jgi:hypothetical protein